MRKRRPAIESEPFTDADIAMAMFDGGGSPLRNGYVRPVPPELIRVYVLRRLARGDLEQWQADRALARIDAMPPATSTPILPAGARIRAERASGDDLDRPQGRASNNKPTMKEVSDQ